MRQKSDRQELRDNGWLRAIVYCRLLEQKRKHDSGVWSGQPFHCEGCGVFVSDDIVEAISELRPCHVVPRKEGTGVRFYATGALRDIGLDTYENIYAGCDDCNFRDHLNDRSEPRWSA